MGEFMKRIADGERIKIGTCEDLEDGFGHWLAGFIDGEGCFSISVERDRPGLRCRFDLCLRADDQQILQECVERTTLGYVSHRRLSPSGRPAAQWVIQSKYQCAGLVEILDRYPLRAKKQADYRIWREAVLVQLTVRQGRRAGNEDARLRMTELRGLLLRGREWTDG